MISERRGICKRLMYTILAMVIAQASSALAVNSLNSLSQNAINPRNSSTETPTGGESCTSFPNLRIYRHLMKTRRVKLVFVGARFNNLLCRSNLHRMWLSLFVRLLLSLLLR